MMPRLLIVSTVPEALRGFLLPYAEHFRALGWVVDGAARRISADAECREAFHRVWDIDWSRHPLDFPKFVRAPRQVREAVREGGYSIVHVHTPVAALLTRFALRQERKRGSVKVIYTAHGFHFHAGGGRVKNAIFAGLEKLAGAWTDFLIVINRDDEEAARRLRLAPPDRIRYTPGIGIDLTKYSPAAAPVSQVEAVLDELGLGPDNPLLLTIAEFNPGKRHGDLLRAFSQLDNPRVHLALAGTGPLLEQMRRLAGELGIAARVHFLGFRRDIPALIKASVGMVLPSEREGLPRSVLESLSMGVPVIGTQIRGVTELLEGGPGYLVTVGDIAGFREAMESLLADVPAAIARGELGIERVRSYDIQRLLHIHEEIYREALDLPHNRRRGAYFKRGFDILVSAAAMLLLAPLILSASVFTAILLGRPVIYRDRRPGLRGRPFTLYKFRSMTNRTDAGGNLLPDELRLTAAGQLLRNLSLDELPQLWNVLRGDMSLVGPRPLVERYVARYSTFQLRRLEVRPGITGWAQVHGRNAISWTKKFEMDVWYVDNMSFWLDTKILGLTFLKVIRRDGIVHPDCATSPEFLGDAESGLLANKEIRL